MVKASIKILVLISIVLLPIRPFGAETVRLKYIQSIYFDEKSGSMKQPEGVASGERTS